MHFLPVLNVNSVFFNLGLILIIVAIVTVGHAFVLNTSVVEIQKHTRQAVQAS